MTSQDPERVSRAEQARRTRERILDTSARLFRERGYDATSLQLIADELGLTKAAVYYHYRTKADILRDIVIPGFERLAERLAAVDSVRRGPQRMQAVADAFVELLIEQRGILRVARAEQGVKIALADDMERFDRIRDNTAALLYGPDSSTEQRAAVYALGGLVAVVIALADHPEDELRDILTRTCLRLLRVP